MIKKPIRIAIVGGIRTHYIKIKAIQYSYEKLPQELKNCFDLIYINVSQHYDKVLTGFIEELGVHFDYTLQHDSKDSYQILSSIFAQLGVLIQKLNDDNPLDYIMVMGDVATTAVSSLVSVIKRVSLIHIEAGVRILRGIAGEEYYRTASDAMSEICFASTPDDYNNLKNEGYGARAVFSGDIIYDFVKDYVNSKSTKSFNYYRDNQLCEYKADKAFVLSSLHHAENLNPKIMQNLFDALNELPYESIFIAHPRVKRILKDNSINLRRTLLVDGIPYLDNLKAISLSEYCITDSGGIQREAFYFNKRCVVRSDYTIWMPIVNIGSNIVSGNKLSDIKQSLKWADKNKSKVFDDESLFGKGSAVETIFKSIYEKKNEAQSISK